MYNNRRTKNNKLTKNVKDYIIPIIIGLFAVLIIFNIFRSGEDKTTKTEKVDNANNSDWVKVSFKIPNTKAFVFNDKKEKTELSDKSSINFWNKLFVEKGIVDFEKSKKIKWILNARWDLKINKNNNFKLMASDLFLEPKEATKVEMTFLTVNLDDEWIVSLTQNEAASSVYVLSWYASVKTKTSQSIIVPKWKKITILSKEAHKKNFDIKTKIVDIEKSYLDETWCSIVKCVELLKAEKKESSTGAIKNTEIKKPIKLQKTKLIEIKTVKDWEEIFENKIDIRWKIIAKNISDITINNISATIDSSLGIFTLKNFELKEPINDVIYKVFDNSGDLIWRGVITLYHTWKIWRKNSPKAQTVNYPENNNYIIEFPSNEPFTTTDTKLTIKWRVPAWVVSKIMVNNFTLTKFAPNSTIWWYHANMIHWNMKEWTNEYKIKYFWADWKLLHTKVYFIIKK